VPWRDRHITFARNALCMIQTLLKATIQALQQGDSSLKTARSHR
jgi:hypothetical protein